MSMKIRISLEQRTHQQFMHLFVINYYVISNVIYNDYKIEDIFLQEYSI